MFTDGLRHAHALPLIGHTRSDPILAADRVFYVKPIGRPLLPVIDMKLAVVQQPMQTD